jgi:hypothetical protein
MGRVNDTRPVVERFLEQFDRTDGCWMWTGNSIVGGYGLISAHKEYGSHILVHRLSYMHFVGPIPAKHVIDHLCHTADPTCPGGTDCLHRLCVRPDHLEAITHGENVRRAWAHRKAKAAYAQPPGADELSK